MPIDFSLEDDSTKGDAMAQCDEDTMDEMMDLGLDYNAIFRQVGEPFVQREDSPVDPLLVASSVRQGDGVVEPAKEGALLAFGKSLMPAKEGDLDATLHMDKFVDTTLVQFPFGELAIKQTALRAFYLYEWYRLWDIPAAALKAHMGEPWNPCSNPVTLDEVNAPLLKQYPYVVSTKTNGLRVQVMITVHPMTGSLVVLMVDRTMGMYEMGVQMLGSVGEEMRLGCILDGELVERSDGRWGFILFDVIAQRGHIMRRVLSMKDRLESVWEWYEALPLTVLPNGLEFVWMTKGMFSTRDPWAIDKVMGEVRPYATDGLVLTPLLFSVPFETSPFLFKWKPGELHSVDFRLVGHAPKEGKRDKWGLELKYRYQTKERNLLQGFWFIGYMFSMGSIGIQDSGALQNILQRWKAQEEQRTCEEGLVGDSKGDDLEFSLDVSLASRARGGKKKQVQSEALPSVPSAGKRAQTKVVYECICECKLDVFDLEKELMMWSIVRERTDKRDPNSDITLLGTLKTIMFPMSLGQLKSACSQAE